jgi:hypothetical protein
MCTVGVCDAVTGACQLTTNTCDDGVNCTVDSCDPATGCQHQAMDLLCDNQDPCKVYTCDPVDGCKTADFTCEGTDFFCIETVCVAFNGCSNQSLECLNSAEDDCGVAACKEEEDQCIIEARECASAVVVTAAVISTAAVIGIVIGVVAIVACAGGSSFMAYRHFNVAGNDAVVNNPLYKSEGNQGTNPLYKA